MVNTISPWQKSQLSKTVADANPKDKIINDID